MIADPRQPQWSRLADQFTENAVSTGERADTPAKLLIDPDGEEAGKAGLLIVEDAHRGISRARQVAGFVQDPDQNRIGLAFGDERSANLEQSFEPIGVQVDGFHPCCAPELRAYRP